MPHHHFPFIYYCSMWGDHCISLSTVSHCVAFSARPHYVSESLAVAIPFSSVSPHHIPLFLVLSPCSTCPARPRSLSTGHAPHHQSSQAGPLLTASLCLARPLSPSPPLTHRRSQACSLTHTHPRPQQESAPRLWPPLSQRSTPSQPHST